MEGGQPPHSRQCAEAEVRASHDHFPPSTDTGDFVGVLLPWVGDKTYAHEALRKAAAKIDDLGFGALRQCFTIVPTSPAQDSPAADRQVNVFRGFLAEMAVDELEQRRGITLLDDQKKVLQEINKSDQTILSIPSLAGTGKTTLMTVLVELMLPVWEGKNNAALIIVPSRLLRDEVVTSLFVDSQTGGVADQGDLVRASSARGCIFFALGKSTGKPREGEAQGGSDDA